MITKQQDHIMGFINKLHVRIVDSGYAELTADWNISQVCSPYSRFYLIHSGEGLISYSGGTTVLRPERVYLIPNGMTFDYRCPGFVNQLYFHVNVLTADGYDLLARLQTYLEIPITSAETERVIQAYRGQTLTDAVSLQQSIYSWLAEFIARSPLCDRVLEAYSPFLRQLYALTSQSINAHASVKSLAAQLTMSPSALTKRFKAETGMTLGHYLDSLLFQRAQQLLLSTDDSIGLIADQLGFCDQFYFSRYFRQHQGETPSQYRKRLRVRI